jgi:hypothetical protein
VLCGWAILVIQYEVPKLHYMSIVLTYAGIMSNSIFDETLSLVWTRMKTCLPNKHESSRNRIRNRLLVIHIQAPPPRMHQMWNTLSIFYANHPLENIEGCLAKKCPIKFKDIYRRPFNKITKCICGYNPGYTSTLQNLRLNNMQDLGLLDIYSCL